MQCDQCSSTDLVTVWAKDMLFRRVCENCDHVVAIGRRCDQCDRDDADVYVANMRLPRRNRGGFIMRHCKIRRCPDCATQLPPRWAKRVPSPSC